MPTRFEIGNEHEVERGWEYEVTRHAGDATAHTVRLDWRDHDHWSGGSAPPSRVIAAVLDALADAIEQGARTPEPLPEQFDASTVRRWTPGLDESVRDRLSAVG
ncbi:MAG: hypothetical protein AAGG07_04820 [Planctomycetota bacterium]